MDQNGRQVPPFAPEEYARVEAAAHLTGKSPHDFVRNAALKAAEDPFLKALEKTRDRVPQLAQVVANQDTHAADTSGAWPDPAPMAAATCARASSTVTPRDAVPHATGASQIAHTLPGDPACLDLGVLDAVCARVPGPLHGPRRVRQRLLHEPLETRNEFFARLVAETSQRTDASAGG
jgi:hypothetical protein